jgi:methyl-accepting chemotaxis protein
VTEQHSLSFDRMRAMLMRAAEIRDCEQQQIFDSLDEIHARLVALDALGAVRKRLHELPDRIEVSVLAERLDETVAKLDAMEAAVGSVARDIEVVVDRLATPLAQLDGRLDGVGGRMEGIAGRMEGLDDKLAGLRKRLDDLDNRLDRHELRIDALPGALGAPLAERIGGAEASLRGKLADLDGELRQRLDSTRDEVRRVGEWTGEGLRQLIAESTEGVQATLSELGCRPAVDPTAQLDGLAARIDGLGSRLEQLAARLEAVESAVGSRPDTTALTDLMHQAHRESERRNAGQLDEAMATFAELILGRGPSSHLGQLMPTPRPGTRRPRARGQATSTDNGAADELPSPN